MIKNYVEPVIPMILVTFLCSLIIMPFIRKIANHIGAIDVPKDNRRVHTKPIPKLGGLGIFFGFLLGYIFFAPEDTQMISILIGSFIIIITGICDDIKPLSALYKFIPQILATLVVVFYGDILLNNIDAFGFRIDFGFFAYPLTIFFFLGIINAINLVDGLDGLSGGISSIYFLTIGIIAAITKNMGGLEVTIAFLMLGSTLGFLFHNFHPARIFAGDTGSMFMGFMISVIALLGFKNVTLTSLIVPLLVLAIPIMDTFFAILRRIIKREPISKPDKLHLHHQLLNMGFGHRNTVLIIYFIDMLFAIASILYVLKDAKIGIVVYVILFALVVWVITRTTIISNKKIIKDNLLKKHKKPD
jgi:UDP-GlcNAc:undecaprenyl-phosphate GlcNAc-1-phosphate transferase